MSDHVMPASKSLGTEVTPKSLGSVRIVGSFMGRQIVSSCRGKRALGTFEWLGVSSLASECSGFGRGGRHALGGNGPAEDVCEGISQSRGSRDSVHQVRQGREELVVGGRSERNIGVHSGAFARAI